MQIFSSAVLTAMSSRPEFSGRTDVYLAQRPDLATPLEDAKKGLAPFDVTGDLLSDSYRDDFIERLNRYKEAWDFYDGRHWANPIENGIRKPVFNYCSLIADKGSSWFSGRGFKISARKGNEPVADFLNTVWEQNAVDSLMADQALYGAVTGDMFYYVTVRTTDDAGKDLPKAKREIVVTPINPAYVMPFWSERNTRVMSSCLLQFPVTVRKGAVKLYSIYITPENYTVWLDREKISTSPNPFGRVNVIHAKNLPQPNSRYGQSDIVKVIPLNEEYNTIAFSGRRIIHYHGEPTTLIFGARASNLEKGADRVWSGLPAEAKVENLQIQGTPEAVVTYLKNLEEKILYVGFTPKAALDTSLDHLSNTSGLAMQMKFQPIIEKTIKKQSLHIKPLQQVNELIVLAGQKYLGLDLLELTDYPAEALITDVEFISILPKDQQMELEITLKKLEKRLISRAEAIRQVGTVRDSKRHAIELAADRQSDLVEAYEIQQANNGNPPALSSVFLDSVFLSEDLENLASEASNLSK